MIPVNDKTVLRAKIASTEDTIFWLPIELFKTESKNLFQGDSIAASFRSSGTTSQNRSVSLFSTKGLELYRHNALSTFESKWQQYFSVGSLPSPLEGVSLIPSLSDLPGSSLAQMVAWFSEKWLVTYPKSDEHRELLSQLKRSVWIFGTALDFLRLLDGKAVPLPEGSVIFETGGLKQAGSHLDAQTFHRDLARFFSISERNICSEYSMCELASQAYSIPSKGRIRFRFPEWVRLYVQGPEANTLERSGEGCLVIQDSTRIDYPWPIRTQDMVLLHRDQTFELCGRVPQSSLRGCSYNGLAKTNGPAPMSSSAPLNLGDGVGRINGDLMSRAKAAIQSFTHLCHSEDVCNLLAQILECRISAKQGLLDCLRYFPVHPDDLIRVAQQSYPSWSENENATWFLVAGSTHPCMLFEPLIFLNVLGIRCYLRLSQRSGRYWYELIRHLHLSNVTIVGSIDLNEEQVEALGITHMMIYGSNESIHAIASRESQLPISAFGTHLTASWIGKENPLSVVKELGKDFLALNQRGCFSTRLLMINRPFDRDVFFSLAQQLMNACAQQTESLPLSQQLMLSHYEIELRLEGRMVAKRARPHDPVIYCEDSKLSTLWDMPHLTLPVLWLPALQSHANLNIPDLRRVSALFPLTEDELSFLQRLSCEQVVIVRLGESNCSRWNGYHQNRPYFQCQERY